MICEPRVYAFSIRELVAATAFSGAVEIIFDSSDNLVIPYAAVTAVYRATESICQIHAYSRRYSDEESTRVTVGRESGWIVRDREDGRSRTESWIVVPQGDTCSSITLRCTNHLGERASIPATSEASLRTRVIYPRDHFDIVRFLEGEIGHIAIEFDPMGHFPRLLCGNQNRILESDYVRDFQATHTNFDYSYFETPRLNPGQAGIIYLPRAHPSRLVVYPGFAPTEDLCVAGSTVDLSRGTVIESRETALLCETRDRRGLPNRLVCGVELPHSEDVLPAHCSVGMITKDYLADQKHWYWGLALTRGTEGTLEILCDERLLPFYNYSMSGRLRLFDVVGLCGEVSSVSLDHFKGISVRDVLNRSPEGDVWYVIESDYPMLTIYSILRDPKTGSKSIEHSY